ncbi:MAG: hypothetical protein LBC29_05015, partial [Propionibacteriaceae bacterium]|nr:hypothetical protein [Propionibacteriaceae bacterium]
SGDNAKHHHLNDYRRSAYRLWEVRASGDRWWFGGKVPNGGRGQDTVSGVKLYRWQKGLVAALAVMAVKWV